MRVGLRTRIVAVIMSTAVIAAGGAAAALAAKPVKGATYQGTINPGHASNVTFTISFKVSSTGRRVKHVSLPNGYPVYCQGGGFGQAQSASGAINNGKFKVKLPIYFAPSHQYQGFVVVTGKFHRSGRESGKVKIDFSRSTICNGTGTYTTTG